mmetsp:Transcript_52216/g.121904  ORF Transcript_52216/g.121904 Transcript_52216/m.121904 type:complete len:205 (-) Transcript_52216:23-637(-)
MAFEQHFAEVENGACHLISCCCVGISCTTCDAPCCLDKHKFCCCSGGWTSGSDCVGEKGCLTGFGKTCCCVHACSLNNMALGACDTFVMGRPYGEGLVDDEETAWMQQVNWCCYLLCWGFGCGPYNPVCFSLSKTCCLEEKHTRTGCWTREGICHHNIKVGPVILRGNFPPTKRIGCGVCGCAACRDSPAESRSGLVTPGQQRM